MLKRYLVEEETVYQPEKTTPSKYEILFNLTSEYWNLASSDPEELYYIKELAEKFLDFLELPTKLKSTEYIKDFIKGEEKNYKIFSKKYGVSRERIRQDIQMFKVQFFEQF